MTIKRTDLAGFGTLRLATPLVFSQVRNFNYELLEEVEICGPYYAYYDLCWRTKSRGIVFGAVEIQENSAEGTVRVTFFYQPFDDTSQGEDALKATPEYMHFDDFVRQTTTILAKVGLQLAQPNVAETIIKTGASAADRA